MYKLISVTVGNFRSFYNPQTLTLGGRNAHSVTAIFGPNAGGKSNIAKALSALISCIRRSSDPNFRLPYEPFLLKTSVDERPSTLGIAFSLDERRYEYFVSFLAHKVTHELLREQSDNTNRMNKVFERTDDKLNPYARQYGFGKRLLERTRKDTLLITKGREDNNAYSNIIFGLLDHISIVSPSSDAPTPFFVEMLKSDMNLRSKTLELLKRCDFSIRDIKFTDTALPEDIFDQRLSEVEKSAIPSMQEQQTVTALKSAREESEKQGTYILDWNREARIVFPQISRIAVGSVRAPAGTGDKSAALSETQIAFIYLQSDMDEASRARLTEWISDKAKNRVEVHFLPEVSATNENKGGTVS